MRSVGAARLRLFPDSNTICLPVKRRSPRCRNRFCETYPVIPGRFETLANNLERTEMKRFPLLVIFLFVLALIPGRQNVFAAVENSKPAIDDGTISADVKAKLTKDTRLRNLTGLGVKSTNGIVVLEGKVKNGKEKMIAGMVARTVKGVKKVRNNLQLVP